MKTFGIIGQKYSKTDTVRSGEKAVIQLFVLDQTSKYIRYIPKYSCLKNFLSNLSPSLDSTIADDCPDLNDEQFLENLSAICFTTAKR